MSQNHRKIDLTETKGFQSLMEYLDVENYLEKTIELSDSQIQNMIDWQTLEEERFEANILLWLENQKTYIFNKFENEFVPAYEQELGTPKSLQFLSNLSLEPREKYKQVGNYRFSKKTIPKECKEWFQKQELGGTVEVVSQINPDPFKESMDNSTFRAYNAGGGETFTILNIPLSFNLLDEDALKRLKDYSIQLSNQVASHIQTEIQYQILEGIKNFESIPEIRNRVTGVWNKPIEVNVPPKIKDGKIIRSGYSYNLSAQQWATTVSRTEIVKAFNLGRIDAYKQTGLVKQVEHVVVPDERLCPICAPMSGNIYSLKEASTVFPVHANCRCTPIPIVDYNGDSPLADIMTENVRQKYTTSGL